MKLPFTTEGALSPLPPWRFDVKSILPPGTGEGSGGLRRYYQSWQISCYEGVDASVHFPIRTELEGPPVFTDENGVISPNLLHHSGVQQCETTCSGRLGSSCSVSGHPRVPHGLQDDHRLFHAKIRVLGGDLASPYLTLLGANEDGLLLPSVTEVCENGAVP